ncbi:MAG: tRNA uridine-5-carboxymethylaminomethyl(34) synthesis GTPase MnmE [Candidatus Hydrogenedentota bacterium]
MQSDADTIAAISTPPGAGGIGIVRVSGPTAVDVVRGYFVSATGKDISGDARQVYYGEFCVNEEAVDEVLVHVMRGPHSYTAEDVVEINGHGGAAPLQAILSAVLEAGARLAGPGEFTQRAFMNGRIDLVQAEAVMDRIQAMTQAGLKAASAAARGALSKTLHAFREDLVLAKAHIEAAVDFPDDDLPELITPELKARIDGVLAGMESLFANADAGRLYREGASAVIAGKPNVGKSSLFNALLRDARAIVTHHAGTTRDVLEEVISIEGIAVKLVDMAGIRETDDDVERIGVDRARVALSESDVVLFVVDASAPLSEEDRRILDEALSAKVPTMLIANKIDLGISADLSDYRDEVTAVCEVSAVEETGLAEMEHALGVLLRDGKEFMPDQGMITRAHQKDSLRRGIEALKRLQGNYDTSPEFMSIDMDDALAALGEITGETTPDEVLGHIFNSFCIGK